MKKLSDDFYIFEPDETITIKIHAVNTPDLSAVALDGSPIPREGERFEFQAPSQKGTTHFLVFAFTFSGTEQTSGSYQVNLSGSAGGSSKFSVELSSSNPISTLTRNFRVGSAEGGKVGLDPPAPWPHG
jgi:hypothetical protein